MRSILVALMIFFLFSVSANPVGKISRETEVLKSRLEAAPPEEQKTILLELARKTYDRVPDESIAYCRQLLVLSQKTDDLKSKARAYTLLNYAYSVKGDVDKCFDYCKKALAIYKDQKDRKGIADTLNSLGMLYLNIDYLKIAQGYLLESLKIRQLFASKKDLYTSYLYLGLLYYNLEDYNNAVEYCQKALTVTQEADEIKGLTVCSYYTGVCYQKLKQNEKAMQFLQRALELAKKNGYNYYIGGALANIGDLFGTMGQYQKALNYLFQSQEIREKNDFKSGLIYTKYYIANVYLKLKDYDNASNYYRQTIKIAGQLKDKMIVEKVYKNFAILNEEKKNYKEALHYYKMHTETRESILNEKKVKQIAELEIRFEAEKREKEIDILTRDNQIQKLTRNASIIGIALLLIILVLVFKKYLYLLAFWKTHKYIWQYRIIERIGSGGMGTVYRAHAISDKSHIAAVKVLREEMGEDEESRRRFKQESVIIDKLDHPNIVKIYERGDYKGKLYIAMELLEGKTLAQKINEGKKIPLAQCLHIMVQITEALAFIHDKDVVHRDMKPANIMLIDKNGDCAYVKLLDFGVALMKFQTRLTQSGVLVGTISYIAPEQITDYLYSTAGDIYALGIIFYEMLTGKPAFQGKNITSVVERILGSIPEEPVIIRTDIPAELNRLIMRMLSKPPDRRPSATEVLEALNM